ncbi:MAG: hypothetical protein ACI92G_001579 [Candidatus Pelagisphaera sp.]|jgi:hypothetical protein
MPKTYLLKELDPFDRLRVFDSLRTFLVNF